MSKLYVLNFGIGVASGLPMEFQFGTNWAPLSEAVGDFFGVLILIMLFYNIYNYVVFRGKVIGSAYGD